MKYKFEGKQYVEDTIEAPSLQEAFSQMRKLHPSLNILGVEWGSGKRYKSHDICGICDYCEKILLDTDIFYTDYEGQITCCKKCSEELRKDYALEKCL